MQDGKTEEVIKAYLSTFAQIQKTGYDLRKIENRIGDGVIKFTGVEFLDLKGASPVLIRSGHPLKIRLHYEAIQMVYNPIFNIKIFSQTGTLVTTISTWGTGMEIPHLSPGNGFIDLDIDYLSLMPNRYFLSLALQKVGHYRHDVLDHCVSFDVETSDVYHSGRGLDSRWGLMFLTGDWTLNTAPHSGKFSQSG